MYGRNDNIGCLTVSVNRVGDGLKVNVNRVGDGLKVDCCLVCTANKVSYLRVEPEYVWLTPDMLSGEFDVVSNVSWNIV